MKVGHFLRLEDIPKNPSPGPARACLGPAEAAGGQNSAEAAVGRQPAEAAVGQACQAIAFKACSKTSLTTFTDIAFPTILPSFVRGMSVVSMSDGSQP